MHTVTALLCFVVVKHWLIFPYPSGLLHWHCGNLTIAPVPAKQPWWMWINTSCEFIMNDCITTTKQSTTKPCAYFLGYTVCCIIVNILLYDYIRACNKNLSSYLCLSLQFVMHCLIKYSLYGWMHIETVYHILCRQAVLLITIKQVFLWRLFITMWATFMSIPPALVPFLYLLLGITYRNC